MVGKKGGCGTSNLGPRLTMELEQRVRRFAGGPGGKMWDLKGGLGGVEGGSRLAR